MEPEINVKENLAYVNSEIKKAALLAERNPDEVTLIAVTKTKPFEMLMDAYEYGTRDFGENKVQDLCAKWELAPKDSRFHMIGHLQKNKVKYLIGKVYLIHGVDSLELVKVIEKESAKANQITNILIEVNVAEEESKFGIKLEQVNDFVREAAKYPHVKICGLMTIAPYVERDEDNRQYFVDLRNKSIDIARENIDNVSMNVLSMGMTGDYRVAVSEGATYVRVGTGIFGERNYQKES